MRRYRRWAAGAALGVTAAGLAAGLAWAAATSRLVINGQVATTDVRIINGQAYVPLAATAKALNMTVVKKPGVYELVVAGGAMPIAGGRSGKLNDWLFTGQWRFRVTGVREAATYTEQYYQLKRTLEPQGPGETLLIVDCQLKNGIQKTQSPVLTERMPRNTGLADADGHSYAPLDYDAEQAINKTQSYEGKPLLPGALADFALVFSVPKGTKPAALVFTAFRYTPPPESPLDDLRVDLTGE